MTSVMVRWRCGRAATAAAKAGCRKKSAGSQFTAAANAIPGRGWAGRKKKRPGELPGRLFYGCIGGSDVVCIHHASKPVLGP